jgi:Zn-finger nucleic acid-binding protein
MDERKCPGCASRMIESPEARGAWGCTSCGGVWAGVSLANEVASVLDPAMRELADAAGRTADARRSRMPEPGERRCPECRVQLTWRELAGVEVDVCSEHGTWFDHGELQRVADARGGKRPASSAKIALNSSGNAVATEAVSLFLSICPPRDAST